jgi:hypothetical protein
MVKEILDPKAWSPGVARDSCSGAEETDDVTTLPDEDDEDTGSADEEKEVVTDAEGGEAT